MITRIKLTDLKGIGFTGANFVNLIRPETFWADGTAEVLADPSTIQQAILLQRGGWYHPYYNDEAKLGELIQALPATPDPRFTALPTGLQPLTARHWPQLHYNPHSVIEYDPERDSGFVRSQRVEILDQTDLPHLLKHQPYLDEYGGAPYLAHRLDTTWSLGIREAGELAAWVIVHDDGSIGFLRVMPAYRRRGLARELFRELAHRVIATGNRAISHVSHYNLASIAFFERLNARAIATVAWVRVRAQTQIAALEAGDFDTPAHASSECLT